MDVIFIALNGGAVGIMIWAMPMPSFSCGDDLVTVTVTELILLLLLLVFRLVALASTGA